MYLFILCFLLSCVAIYLCAKDDSAPVGISIPSIGLIWLFGMFGSVIVFNSTNVEKIQEHPLVAIEGKYVNIVNGTPRVYIRDENQLVESRSCSLDESVPEKIVRVKTAFSDSRWTFFTEQSVTNGTTINPKMLNYTETTNVEK